MRILWGITGSYCNHQIVLEQIKKISKDHEIQFVVSDAVYSTTTRFFESDEFLNQLKKYTTKPILHSIVQVEPLSNQFDAMILAPLTATTLGKLAHGIYDGPVTMATKVMLRNQHPVICAISSNDILGISGENWMRVYNMKHFYFVPFYQDAPHTKPNSVVSEYEMLYETLECAMNQKQIQPVMKERRK